jgi:hypothetical protein
MQGAPGIKQKARNIRPVPQQIAIYTQKLHRMSSSPITRI